MKLLVVDDHSVVREGLSALLLTFGPDTKVIGVPGFEFAFRIHAQLDEPRQTRTPRSGRMFQQIVSGEVSGPRLKGTLHPNAGMQINFVERDGVQEINTRLMVRADTTEWIYIEQRGYRRPDAGRPDGYVRIQAQIDADKQGKYGQLNGAMFVGTVEEVKDSKGREVVMSYYELV